MSLPILGLRIHFELYGCSEKCKSENVYNVYGYTAFTWLGMKDSFDISCCLYVFTKEHSYITAN